MHKIIKFAYSFIFASNPMQAHKKIDHLPKFMRVGVGIMANIK
jgi:hypothetical protein